MPCNSCGRALSVEEGGHRSEAVTCPECGAQLRFPSGPAPWEDAVPDPVPSDPDWFVLLQTKQVGPLDAQALVERVRSGEVHGRTFVWRDGFDGWRRALEVPELIPVLEEAGFAATAPHGPLTPAEGVSGPGTPTAGRTPSRGKTPPRAATPSDRSPVPRRPAPAPAQPAPTEELELARTPRSARPPAPERDFVPAGLTQKSPWKLALVLCAALALPVGGLAWLVSLRREPIVASHEETPLDAPGTAPAPAAPARRVQELRDLLLGKRAPPPAPPAPVSPPQKHTAPETKAAPKPPDGAKTAELRALYGDGHKSDVGPRVRRTESASSGRGGGPSSEEVSRVVGQTQGAFQSCIEQQLRKNPSFRGGKVSLVATLGSSGTVKQVQLDRHDLEGTDLGDCLKARARRMVFAAFSGDDVDVEIPLVLTTTL